MQQIIYDFKKIEKAFSKERLGGYTTNYAVKHNYDPIELYRWNILLSGSLYPLLHIIEVALRNSLHNAIAEHFNDVNWLINSDFLAENELREIQKQISYLENKRRLTNGHLITELNFGFWTCLLDRRYEHNQLLWPKLLRTTFPYLENRKIHLIRRSFNKIRILRNRIYHYEPIWHWQDLLAQHEQIIQAISWIEPELLKLVELNKLPEIYQAGPKGKY